MSVKNLQEFSTSTDEKRITFETPLDTISGDRFVIINEKVLEKKIDERVEEKIKKILEAKQLITFRKISDISAQKEITSFILQMKSGGVTKISILDIINNLNLPPEQIEKIMEKFEKVGRINEING